MEDDSAKHFASSISECEKAIDELDEESMRNFSSVGMTILEVRQQAVDIQVMWKDNLTWSYTGQSNVKAGYLWVDIDSLS